MKKEPKYRMYTFTESDGYTFLKGKRFKVRCGCTVDYNAQDIELCHRKERIKPGSYVYPITPEYDANCKKCGYFHRIYPAGLKKGN